jgi:hypothetical protein
MYNRELQKCNFSGEQKQDFQHLCKIRVKIVRRATRKITARTAAVFCLRYASGTMQPGLAVTYSDHTVL